MAQDPQNPTTSDQNDGKTGPGWSGPGAAGTTSGPVSKNSGFVDDVKLYWRQIMDTSILAPVQGLFNSADEIGQQIVKNELAHAHPIRAALAKGYFEVQKDVTDLLSGLTTPTNVGLGIISGGESAAAKVVATASGLYFGWRGSQQMLTGRQAGETQADEIRRRSFGALQAVAGGAGATTGGVNAKEALRSSIQNNLGLSGELAAKVQTKVELAQEAEAQAAKEQAGVVKTTKTQADAAQAVGEGTAAVAAAQTPIELNKIIDQATHEIATQQSYFNTEYGKLEAQAKAPVTTADDLKAEIINSIKAKGVQDAEIKKIENKIFIALPGNPTLDRLATKAETNAADLATVLSTGGMNLETIRKTLANQAYQPQQIDKALSLAFPEAKSAASTDVSFEASKRVKDDLWDAAQSATDTDMRNGLLDAHANVTGMRQRYADAQGFGPQHNKLNAEYMKFKRELGSGMVEEFTKAKDFHDQNTILLTAKNLINQDSGEALRKLLDLHGIDTTPLKAALEEHKAFAPLPEQALPEIIKQAEAQSKQIETTKNQAVTTIGETNAIIPGKSDLALAGKGNLQIRLDAMQAIANNATKIGIRNFGAYVQLIWGAARLLAGSPFGGFSAASGGTRLAIEKMLRSKSFQDYVAQESGVAGFNPNVTTRADQVSPKVRQMLQETLDKTTARIDEEVQKAGWTPAKQAAGMPVPENIQQLVDQANALRAGIEKYKSDRITVNFRLALAKSYPYLEKIAASTVVAGAINKANQPKTQPFVVPPTAPPATNKPISIAGSQ